MPAFSASLVEDEGVLGARKYEPTADGAGTWWLFDSEGRVTGQLKTPAGLEIMDVGSGLIAGVWRDELGVEHVRVYRR
jgi:hypothetical protein